MGVLFTLPQTAKDITRQALDDLITELGKPCRLIYPPVPVPCAACVADPIGQKPGNAWIHGGPSPMSGMVCPDCGGTGYRADSVTELIVMSVAVTPAHFWLKPPSGMQVPVGTIQTKTYLTNRDKLRRARRMILQPDAPGGGWVYELDGDPVDVSNIIQSRYCVANWKRAG